MFRHILPLVLFFPFSHAVLATDYYVSPTGDDRNGGSKSRPFQTVARGVSAARVPGDVVVLRAGVYVQSRTLTLANPGSDGRMITLRSYEGEEAIIDGAKLPADTPLISVATHHVRIMGLTIRNATGIGVSVWGPGSRIHHVDVLDNTVHHCGRNGIYTAFNSLRDPVRDILIEGNTIHHNVQRNRQRPRQSWDFGVGSGPSVNVTIRNNVVFKNYGEGLGFYLADQGVIEGNIVYDNYSINIYLDNATNMRVNRNLVYGTGDPDYFRFNRTAPGIQIANEEYGVSNPSSHNTITNNLLINNLNAFSYGGYQRGGGLRHTVFANNTARGSTGPLLLIHADDGHENTRIVNNIFEQTGRAPITDVRGDLQGVLFRNNLWSGGTPQPSARSSDDVNADPRLGARGNAAENLKPQSNSPARNAGQKIAEVSDDFGGNPRGRRPDIGAWEIPE